MKAGLLTNNFRHGIWQGDPYGEDVHGRFSRRNPRTGRDWTFFLLYYLPPAYCSCFLRRPRYAQLHRRFLFRDWEAAERRRRRGEELSEESLICSVSYLPLQGLPFLSLFVASHCSIPIIHLIISHIWSFC